MLHRETLVIVFDNCRELGITQNVCLNTESSAPAAPAAPLQNIGTIENVRSRVQRSVPPAPCDGGVGRHRSRPRARATEGPSSASRTRGSAGHRRRSARGDEPSRSAHRPASPRQAAAQRGVVEEGAVLRVVVGHESAPMAQRARPAHRVRSRSPSWVPRRARDDSGRRTSEALTYLPQMSLPGGRPYPRGRGGPARRLGGGHGDPNTTPRARPGCAGSSRLARASKLKEIAGA